MHAETERVLAATPADNPWLLRVAGCSSIFVRQPWQCAYTVYNVVQELHCTYGLAVLHAARKDPTCSEGAGCGWGR